MNHTLVMDESAKEQHPNLLPFLQQRLPELGLDEETYAPYVLGTTEDEEELTEVVQLLQASSESHAEEEEIWESLRKDICEKMKLDKDYHEQKHQKELESQKAKLEDQLAQAKLEQQNAPEKEEKKSSKVDDATKKALMQRFGYEEDGDGSTTKDEGEAAATNKQVAAAANLERARELRSKKIQTKKGEQQKTKEQKANKAQLKEDRRKRTTKGERKR